MAAKITLDAVKRLFKGNHFNYVSDDTGTKFIYNDGSGFSLEFPVKWINLADPNQTYDLAKVRHVLATMTESAKTEEAIFKFMKDKKKMAELFDAAKEYKLAYDPEKSMLICKKGKKALFVVELDYLVALKIGPCKDMSYKEIFDNMKEQKEAKK